MIEVKQDFPVGVLYRVYSREHCLKIKFWMSKSLKIFKKCLSSFIKYIGMYLNHTISWFLNDYYDHIRRVLFFHELSRDWIDRKVVYLTLLQYRRQLVLRYVIFQVPAQFLRTERYLTNFGFSND